MTTTAATTNKLSANSGPVSRATNDHLKLAKQLMERSGIKGEVKQSELIKDCFLRQLMEREDLKPLQLNNNSNKKKKKKKSATKRKPVESIIKFPDVTDNLQEEIEKFTRESWTSKVDYGYSSSALMREQLDLEANVKLDVTLPQSIGISPTVPHYNVTGGSSPLNTSNNTNRTVRFSPTTKSPDAIHLHHRSSPTTSSPMYYEKY